MSESPIRNIIVKSPDGIEETIAAEQIDEHTFQILENPLFSCQVNYGTIVKVALNTNRGQLEVTRISRPSTFSTRQFLMSEILNQQELNHKFVKIIESGGTWEVAMGGLIFFHLPKDGTFNLDDFLKGMQFHATEIIDDENKGGVT